MLCCHPAFRPLLTPFEPGSLENHAGSIVGLFGDNRIAYLNPSWYQFAHDNGGASDVPARWDLGDSMISAIGRSLLPFYVGVFSDCRRTQRPWQHSYECSSAELLRQFHMKVYPLSASGDLLLVHSLVIERPQNARERPPQAAVDAHYRGPRGMISQCPHCRRCQHGVDPDRWDWVPDWVRRPPPNAGDTLCPMCRDFYYPAQ
jgi:hypothetical protein